MKRQMVDSAVRSARPRTDGKPYKMTDGGGLYLLINSTGKYWRYNYRFLDKHKTLALGVYPDIGLKEAREVHEAARARVQKGIDPNVHKKAAKANNRLLSENTFEAVAREWFTQFESTWVESHSKRLMNRLENDVFPWLGKRPIHEIEPPEILDVVRRVQSRGALESAHRTKSICGQVFRYAVSTGRAKRDQTADLKGALPQPPKRHFAAIKTAEEMKLLLARIDAYQGSTVVKSALKLSPLVMLRPGELRHGTWDEIDFESATWTIPTKRMKARKSTKDENIGSHIVPLSTQAVDILRKLHPHTENFKYIFTGARDRKRPMSENAVRCALRSMDYSNEQMTAHGFRSTASTLLNEMGFNPDAIEAQLAHKDQNEIRAAYNRAAYIKERRTMLQAWADYLDELARKGSHGRTNNR